MMIKLILRLLFLFLIFGRCEAQSGPPIRAQIPMSPTPLADFGVYLANIPMYRVPKAAWILESGNIYQIPSPFWLQRNQRLIQADVMTVTGVKSDLSNVWPQPDPTPTPHCMLMP